MNSVENIREFFRDQLKHEVFVTDKSGVKTIEMINASFIADEPAIFGTPNQDYIDREIKWYMSQSLNVNDLENTPEIWKNVADKNGYINSNYGWCIFSNVANTGRHTLRKHNYNQYERCVSTLKQHRESRQAVMIYTRPQMHNDAVADGRSDFMCTNTVQYLIRDNHLHAIVNMRSNDVVFGYRNDYAWQLYVIEMMKQDLDNIEGHTLHWQVGSLHVYERHFDMVK